MPSEGGGKKESGRRAPHDEHDDKPLLIVTPQSSYISGVSSSTINSAYFGGTHMGLHPGTPRQIKEGQLVVRDPADNQIHEWHNKQKGAKTVMTSSLGAPIHKRDSSLTAGPQGPMVIDVNFMDELSHFNRERIPERVVHARGSGAHGVFEVTHDFTKYCKADLFSHIGKKTPVFVRFSTGRGELGTPDVVRDPRGFAVKFYTNEGNWDLAGFQMAAFFLRDSRLFPDMVHVFKRNPRTNIPDPDPLIDFFGLRPEIVHSLMFLFGDRGQPDGYRHMDGFSINTFKLVNKEGKAHFCKFHFKTCQGIKCLSNAEVGRLCAEDPDYSARDLYNAIENENYPSWTLEIQVMTEEEAKNWKYDPFDATKTWPYNEFPRHIVGKMTLNRNVDNHFAEVEQAAFSPGHVVPGIEFSPDKVLQGRIFAYRDAALYRVGTNHTQLPINCPFRSVARNTMRDGVGTIHSQGEAPNYYPNSFNGPEEKIEYDWNPYEVSGKVDRYSTSDNHNYEQSTILWTKCMTDDEKSRFVESFGEFLKRAQKNIRTRCIQHFYRVHEDCGKALTKYCDDWDEKQYALAKAAAASE